MGITAVLERPKYSEKYHLTSAIRKQLLTRLLKQAELVTTLAKPAVTIRDPKDAIVLATALDGGADYLITGDKDLLVLKNNAHLAPLKILTVDEFLGQLS